MTTAVTPPAHWVFQARTQEELNEVADVLTFPFVNVDRPLRASGKNDNRFGAQNNYYSLSLFFAGALFDIAAHQEERETNIQLMNKAAREFVQIALQDGSMQVSEWSITEAYNEEDSNCDGIYLNIKIRIDDTFCL